MTLAQLPRFKDYAADGVSTVFPIPFQFFATTDILVLFRDGDGVETRQTTGFTISGGDGATGACTFTVAPPALVGTVIVRARTPITQPTEFPQGGTFPSKASERGYDRGIAIAQEHQDQIDDHAARAVLAPPGEVGLTLAPASKSKAPYRMFGRDPVTGRPAEIDLPESFRGAPGGDASQIGTLLAAAGMPIAAAIQAVTTIGHSHMLDAGGARYERAAAEPTHPGKFRSVDRFLPDGTTDDVNGGWWEIAEEKVGPHHFGALAGADATDGWQDAIDYMHLADRPIYPIDGLYTLGGARKGTNNTLLSIPDGANVRILGTGEGCRLFVPNNFTAAGDYMMMGHAEAGMTCGVVEIRGVHFDGNGFNNPVLDSTTHLRRAYAIRLHRGDTVIVADCFFSAIPGRCGVLLGDNGSPIPFDSISILDNRFVDMGGAIPGCEGQNDHSSIYTQSTTAIVRGNVLINTNADFDPQATPFRSCTALEVQSINAIVEQNQIVNFGTGGNAVAVLYDVNQQVWADNQFIGMKQNVLKPYTTMQLKSLVIRNNLVEIDNKAGNIGGSGFFQDPNAPTTTTKYSIGTLVIEDNDFVCLNEEPMAASANGVLICAVDNLYIRRNRFRNWQSEGILLTTHSGGLGIGAAEIDGNDLYNNGLGTAGSAVFSIRIVNTNPAITFANIAIGHHNKIGRRVPAVGDTPPNTRGIRISGPGRLINFRIEMPEFSNFLRPHRIDFTSPTNNKDIQVIPRQRVVATAAAPDAGFFDVGHDMIVHSDWAAGGSFGRVPTTGGCAFEATWAASTDYVKGQWIKFSSAKYGKVVVGGTSGSTLPAPDTLGETFVDGTVTWLFVDTAAAVFKTFGAIAA